MFFQGFNFGLSAIGYMFNSSLSFNIGVWLGVSSFGVIQGWLALYLVRKFFKGGF